MNPVLRLTTLAILGAFFAFELEAQEDPPAPLPLNEAVQKMTFPDGFKVTLFAGEPDVVQPIAMTTDERGRLWVIECLSYPSWTNNVSEDRVVIFEDTNGDGKYDKTTLVADWMVATSPTPKANLLPRIEVPKSAAAPLTSA